MDERARNSSRIEVVSTHYIAVIEKEPKTAFGVWFPDVEGCFSAGETLDETTANAAAALRQHVEALESAGRKLPKARTLEEIFTFGLHGAGCAREDHGLKRHAYFSSAHA